MANFAVVGAGLSGAVIARELGEQGHQVDVFEKRNHVAGNCHTERDPETGVMVHVYGPHIFHTDNEEVWSYLGRFTRFMPYVNRVKAIAGGRVHSLPINLLTINQFFGKTFGPTEARLFVAQQAVSGVEEPTSFEEQALRFIGRPLYEAFFLGYTLKQWGIHPRDLPASILKRLPVRFNYDDNYFAHRFQGMPADGYTAMTERILDCPGVTVHLETGFAREDCSRFDHVFYSGPLDAWFGHRDGRLPYRTLDFQKFHADGDFQGNAVINYCDKETPFTRITEHTHFAPWEQHERTTCYREFSRECGPDDIPYYPVHLTQGSHVLETYQARVREEKGVTFVGRLATYRYIDMDVTVAEALAVVRAFLNGQT